MNKELIVRQNKLVSFLEEKGELDVASLVQILATSEATVRRDLNTLEAAGKIVRTFGGARVFEASSLVLRTFESRE